MGPPRYHREKTSLGKESSVRCSPPPPPASRLPLSKRKRRERERGRISTVGPTTHPTSDDIFPFFSRYTSRSSFPNRHRHRRRRTPMASSGGASRTSGGPRPAASKAASAAAIPSRTSVKPRPPAARRSASSGSLAAGRDDAGGLSFFRPLRLFFTSADSGVFCDLLIACFCGSCVGV